MNDIRQKLLPVFLQEVREKLPVIESFLTTRDSKNCDQLTLEATFRAIHTLKGTSGLLKADSVSKIAVRIEDVLEKHLLRKTCPTQIEYDALSFAHNKMCVLIDCFKREQPEPSGLMKGVMQALDLAEAFSGHPSFVKAQQDVWTAEDPFAEDAAFDSQYEVPDAEHLSAGLLVEQPVSIATPVEVGLPEDPFADDHLFGLLSHDIEEVSNQFEQLYFDPFSEDPDFEPGILHLSADSADLLPSLDRSYSGTSAEKSPQNFSCCSFRLSDRQYSLPIENMVEISDLPFVVNLPLAPAYIHGMVNLRGKVLPVVDLAGCDGTPSASAVMRRMVVVEADGEEFAFLCDGVPSLDAEFSGEMIDPVTFMARYRIGTS